MLPTPFSKGKLKDYSNTASVKKYDGLFNPSNFFCVAHHQNYSCCLIYSLCQLGIRCSRQTKSQASSERAVSIPYLHHPRHHSNLVLNGGTMAKLMLVEPRLADDIALERLWA